MSGGGGPSAAQQQQQQQSFDIAARSEQREIARERELKVRMLARLRRTRAGQSGRSLLRFGGQGTDLGATPNFGPNPNSPTAPPAVQVASGKRNRTRVTA